MRSRRDDVYPSWAQRAERIKLGLRGKLNRPTIDERHQLLLLSTSQNAAPAHWSSVNPRTLAITATHGHWLWVSCTAVIPRRPRYEMQPVCLYVRGAVISFTWKRPNISNANWEQLTLLTLNFIYLFIQFINQQWHGSTSKEHTGRMANTGLTNHLCAGNK